jgi:hypothetical protein
VISRVHGTGRSFKKTCSYLATGEDGLQLERDRVLWVECFDLPTRSWEVASCMMAATASTSVSNAPKPVYHFSISCHPDDPVDAKTLRWIARRTIRDMGLRGYQVVVFAHKDRAHLHLHFVVNRVHPERGTLWSMWRDCYRLEHSLRAQERELGLQVVPGWLAPTPAIEGLSAGVEGPGQEGTVRWLRPSPGPRRGDDDFLRQVAERATPVLERAQSWADVERGLAEHGLSARVHHGGLRFTDGRFQVKASAVGREFSRNYLEKRFGRYPDYRARMAVANQALAPTARAVQPTPPIREQERPAPPLAAPAPEAAAPAAELARPSPQGRVDGRRRPQFGDAGHGIAELFGHGQSSIEREPLVFVESAPAPEPGPERSAADFLKEVQERAGRVFRRAQSWAELERGLEEHGLSLRLSGGGFRVTDGIRDVKASDVGRAFSRFHLEKRLGAYPTPAPIIEPAPPAEAAALPQAPVKQPQQLTLPLPAPAIAEAPAPAPRFTLYEHDGAFGVYDSVGPQLFFAETRERAVAEVERANKVAELYPQTISMRHLREMDDAWRDARGLPRLPEPEGRRITVPAPGLADGMPVPATSTGIEIAPAAPAEPPVVEPIEPTSPTRRRVVLLPELPPPTPALEATTPAADSPLAPVEPPRTPGHAQPLAPALRTQRRVQRQRSAARPRQRVVPRLIRRDPPSARDQYRETVWRFKDQLARLYRDPRAARRAFEATMGAAGPAEAVQILGVDPGQYGVLTRRATDADAETAARWAEGYADWRAFGLRAERVAITELLMAANITEEILQACEDAKADYDAAQHDLAMLAGREKAADAAIKTVSAGFSEVYQNRPAAVKKAREHEKLHRSDAAAVPGVLRNTPELFGDLRPNKDQGWLSRALNGPDTSDARQRARKLADEYDTATNAQQRRPGAEDYSKARERVSECRAALNAAEARRRKLPHRDSAIYVKDAQRVVLSAARKTGKTVEEVMRRVGPSLPRAAVGLVQTVLRDVHRIDGPDHGRRPASYGIDF